ncbi:hypothetical protein ACSBR2_002396 [Camellia fascicularis]
MKHEGDFPHVLKEDISIPRLPNPQLPNSVPWPELETQETRIVGSDLEGQNPTALPFPDGTIGNFWTTKQLPLASGPVELPSYATDHGFGFTVEDIPIIRSPNLQQPWSGENIGELDFLLVAEGPGMQNPQLHYSEGDFPHVLEEDIFIPQLPNPQLPNSVPWAGLETQETRIVSSDLEGQKFIEPPQYLTHEEGAFWNSWNTYRPLQSQTASEASFLSPPVAAHKGTSYASQRKPANLSAKVEGCYKKFSHEDMRKLIKGVKRFGRGRWKDIKKNYFQYSKRTNNELKVKNLHLLPLHATLFIISPILALLTLICSVSTSEILNRNQLILKEAQVV